MELERINISYEVSKLSCFLVELRTGHVVQAIHIFKYLDVHQKNKLVLDPNYQYFESPDLVDARCQQMKEIYPDAQEDIPANVPEPCGNPLQIIFCG